MTQLRHLLTQGDRASAVSWMLKGLLSVRRSHLTPTSDRTWSI
ncbi:hypothetical protein VB713_27055 [Anabaena cylindrica UHCC 0172]|nr:hypothetical protein [Anabaena cylindrica]MEA5554592.1 hypothetical protein [Anabaena cylindrica UHCC 0172]